MATSASHVERNKAIVRSFKECQGTKEQDATMSRIMAPDYNRIRGGLVNLAENAEGQDFPPPGLFLRKALPDTEVRRVAHQVNGNSCCAYEVRSLAPSPEPSGNGGVHE